MSYEATARFRLPPAPAGLALVQELLNTFETGHGQYADLLSTTELAAGWLAAVAKGWASAAGCLAPDLPAVSESDVAAMRRLRDAVRVSVRAGTGAHDASRPSLSGSLSLTLDDAGRVSAVPRGATPAAWLRSAVLAEMLDAQRGETWRRLKLCSSDRCAVAFYDRSKNNSGVWHDARVCGNAINLRASRARRSGRGLTQPDSRTTPSA